jgi:hypothetical protein
MRKHTDEGTDPFTHSAEIRSGHTEMKVHEKLDPSKKNKAGKNIRESFDSEAHPESHPVAVIFDVTGSMASVPRIFVEKLGTLMATLVKKDFLQQPHILFGAVGDATCDRVPLQIGQFESGNEMDEALTLVVVDEQGGGPADTESYELAMYYMARHTDMNHVTKRGGKGYLFLMGDEIPYSRVKKSEVKAVIGDDLQEDIPLETILAELREKFEVFWIIPGGTSHFTDDHVLKPLRDLFGQHLIKLENPADVCEVIASTIGVNEGYDLHEVGLALKDVGADARAVERATSALVPYAKSHAVTKGATATGKLVESGAGDSVTRL